MISPPGLMLKRPGLLIPVFFLSLIHLNVHGQSQWPGTASAAMGNTVVCVNGYWCASQNQAGLGFIEQSSVSLQHGRPYLLKDLGVSSLSAQLRTGNGAIGFRLSTRGLMGFRQSSLWLSYGLKLNQDISAGMGIHLWNSSIAEQLIYAPGISFDLGIQIRIKESWKLGAHLYHPLSFSPRSDQSKTNPVAIETGFSYAFFRVARIYSELHIRPGEPINLCSGAEWLVNQLISLRTGFRTTPFTFSWGISFSFKKCILDFTFQYRMLTGLSPLTSMSYAW